MSPRQPTAYAGLGTWLDIYATASWAEPKRSVAAMARDGVRTLYLQTGNYSQRVDLLHPRALGRFLDAAHAAGLRVVAWYLPSFADPAQDERRALAAIRFRSASGQRFDSFALDIEASLVKPIWLRTQRLLRLSARLRTDAGPHYALGAITPGPVGLRRHPHYWPRFPYRALARVYDAFLPMAYFTDAHVHGTEPTRASLAADVADIRPRPGNLPAQVSALLGRMPSAVGYQPNLATEMGELQERITSTKKGSVTSVQAIYVPADDLTDPAPATTFAHLDATTVLNRALTEIGSQVLEGYATDSRPLLREPSSTLNILVFLQALRGCCSTFQ